SAPMITELTGTIFGIGLIDPIIARIDGPAEPLPIGTATEWTVEFLSRGEPGDQTVTFTWGDGTSSPTIVTPSIAGRAEATHVYQEPGVHIVEVQVTDPFDLESAVYEYRYVVVF